MAGDAGQVGQQLQADPGVGRVFFHVGLDVVGLGAEKQQEEGEGEAGGAPVDGPENNSHFMELWGGGGA